MKKSFQNIFSFWIMLGLCVSAMPYCMYAQADSSQSKVSDEVPRRGIEDLSIKDTVNKTSTFSYTLNPSIGVTFQNISKSDEETLTAQWLANMNAQFQWEGSVFGLSGSLYAQFGQLHTPESEPIKTQDNLLVSVTPSMLLFPSIGIRLFLETTGETQMKEGRIDTVITRFADPLFVYQTLFLGQKISSIAIDGTGEINFTYGIGYALQQTITNQFPLVTTREKYIIGPENPLATVQDQVTLESGISGVVDVNARKQIAEKLSLNLSSKTALLGKRETYQDISKVRVGSLSTLSLVYGVFTIEYNMRLVYDSNFSLRRALDQSLVAGIRFTL